MYQCVLTKIYFWITSASSPITLLSTVCRPPMSLSTHSSTSASSLFTRSVRLALDTATYHSLAFCRLPNLTMKGSKRGMLVLVLVSGVGA